MNEKYLILKRLWSATGDLNYSLIVFGDELARREGYKESDGLEAIYFYLIHKFGWPPSQVRGMSLDDIRFVLAEEMSGWRLPPEAIFSQ